MCFDSYFFWANQTAGGRPPGHCTKSRTLHETVSPSSRRHANLLGIVPFSVYVQLARGLGSAVFEGPLKYIKCCILPDRERNKAWSLFTVYKEKQKCLFFLTIILLNNITQTQKLQQGKWLTDCDHPPFSEPDLLSILCSLHLY